MRLKARTKRVEEMSQALEAQAFEAWLQSLPQDRARAFHEDACSSLAQMGLIPSYSGSPYDLPEEERIDLAERLRDLAGRAEAQEQGLELTRRLWRLHQQPEDQITLRIPELAQN